MAGPEHGMADFKFPQDGTLSGTEPLTADKVIDYPQNILGEGPFILFEVVFTGITPVDNQVAIRFFGGLSFEGLDSPNVQEVIDCVDIGALTGNLTFIRQVAATAMTSFRTILTGTDPDSTATYIIRARSNI